MMMLYLPSGSPTAELFAASYNNRSNKSNTITLELGTSGYKENTDSGWLSVNDNHGIYNKSTSSYWWLASPSNTIGTYSSGYQLNVKGSGGYFFNCYVDRYSYAVRPLVCIPTSVFDSKYGTDTNLVDE